MPEFPLSISLVPFLHPAARCRSARQAPEGAIGQLGQLAVESLWGEDVKDLDAISDAGYALFLGAMGATEERALRFHTMADDPDPSVVARRGQGVDRTFKAIEEV